ncbi:hypothetical protein ACSBR1_025388 [Camellia fascicularis]
MAKLENAVHVLRHRTRSPSHITSSPHIFWHHHQRRRVPPQITRDNHHTAASIKCFPTPELHASP